MLEARAAETERNARKGAAEKENVEGALRILDDQTFDFEDQPYGGPAGQSVLGNFTYRGF